MRPRGTAKLSPSSARLSRRRGRRPSRWTAARSTGSRPAAPTQRPPRRAHRAGRWGKGSGASLMHRPATVGLDLFRDRSPHRPSATTTIEPVFVLGVDPGLSRCGYCVVRATSGRSRAVEWGCSAPIRRRRCPSAWPSSGPTCAACSTSSPCRPFAVERVLFQVNVRTLWASARQRRGHGRGGRPWPGRGRVLPERGQGRRGRLRWGRQGPGAAHGAAAARAARGARPTRRRGRRGGRPHPCRPHRWRAPQAVGPLGGTP